jgi:hypothetical protein
VTLTWTTSDTNAEAVASVSPEQLHQAIADSIIDALNNGIDVELLDGLFTWSTDSTFGTIGDQRDLQRRQLTDEVSIAEVYARNARDNANRTDNEALRTDLLKDAADATDKAKRARERLTEIETTRPARAGSPSDFTGELDFFAHAIGNLARTSGTVEKEMAAGLARILEFTDIDTSGYPDVTFTFNVLIPANRQVARLGPLHATVTNRGYPALLAPDVVPDPAGTGQDKRRYLNIDGSLVQRSRLQRDLIKAGWARHPASVACSSQLPSVLRAVRHLAGQTEAPEGLDPLFIDHLRTTYTSPDFRWRNGRHLTTSAARQVLNDLLVGLGGTLNADDADSALKGTELGRSDLALFSVEQAKDQAIPWSPTVDRMGDWARGFGRDHSVRLIACPHCGGWASKCIRAPEVPSCVICPDCRRMPTDGSPQFPSDYIEASHVAKVHRQRKPRPTVAPLMTTGSDPDELLTTKQSGDLVGCSPAWIARLCDIGRLPHVNRGRWRYIRRGDLETQAAEIKAASDRWKKGRGR